MFTKGSHPPCVTPRSFFSVVSVTTPNRVFRHVPFAIKQAHSPGTHQLRPSPHCSCMLCFTDSERPHYPWPSPHPWVSGPPLPFSAPRVYLGCQAPGFISEARSTYHQSSLPGYLRFTLDRELENAEVSLRISPHISTCFIFRLSWSTQYRGTVHSVKRRKLSKHANVAFDLTQLWQLLLSRASAGKR